MNETGINVKEIAEQANAEKKIETWPADRAATLRVQELAGAILMYANSDDYSVSKTEQCMVYAEEMLDQLAMMKKYGQQEAAWLAKGYR